MKYLVINNRKVEYKWLSSSINRDTNNYKKEKLLKITKQKNSKFFGQKGSTSKLARGRTTKFSQHIYKSLKRKVTENQIDQLIQIDVANCKLNDVYI